MKISDLKLFILVAQYKNFSAAAEALNLSRANVSRKINELEEKLCCRLFTRTTRRLALTPAGFEYLNSIQNLVPRLEAANESIRNQSISPMGHIRLGLIGDADTLAHHLLKNFLDTYPHITIETHVSNLGYHDIMNFGLDACLHIGEITDKSFIARPLTPFIRKLYASPEYLAEHGVPQSLEDLKQHALLNYRFANGLLETYWQFEQAQVQVNSRLTSNSAPYIRHAVTKGAGIGLLLEVSVTEDVQSGALVEVLPEHISHLDNIWLVYPDRIGLSHAARLLIDYLLRAVNHSSLIVP